MCTTQGVYNEDLNKSSRARDQQMGKRFTERQGHTPVQPTREEMGREA